MIVQRDIEVNMAVLIVNWDDENSIDVQYDPVRNGVANTD